jgi:hypothetical protein
MARPTFHRRLADDWPVIFAIGVAIWFAAASLGASGLSVPGNNDAEASTSTSDSSESSSSAAAEKIESDDKPNNSAVIAGPLKMKVVSFQLKTNKKNPGTVEGDVILELRNTTKENVSFYPSQTSLRKVGDPTPVPSKDSIVIGVSPNLPVTAPVTFTLSPDPGARYQLFYGGHVIYSGLPF